MFVAVVCLLVLQLATHGDAVCAPYQSSCSLLTAMTCCGFPNKVLCLPNNSGGFSCLSPLDVQNLSPVITSLNPLAPMLSQVEGTARQIMQAFNPAANPLANPLVDPLANPLVDPLANPLIDPLANPLIDPLVNPMFNQASQG